MATVTDSIAKTLEPVIERKRKRSRKKPRRIPISGKGTRLSRAALGG